MRPKKPTHVLIDQVRITRNGNDAIIDHADANLSGARMAMGAGIAAMTDADIVEMYNDILASQWQPWRPWTRQSPKSRWARSRSTTTKRAINGPREATCSDASSTTADRMGRSSSISTTKSCRSRTSAAYSACPVGDENRFRTRGIRHREPDRQGSQD